MTHEKIMRMYEGREDQINWEKMPPMLSDFPHDCQQALLTYHKYGDRSVSELGFLGKDFTLIDKLSKDVIDISLYLDTLIKIDHFYIEKNAKDIEAARRNAKHGRRSI